MSEKSARLPANPGPVRVAIAQSAPVYLDKRASLAKALELIQQAAKRDAQLVAFGETWLPGYPAWLDFCPGAALWENSAAKDVFATLRSNSIAVPGAEVNALREAARDLKIAIVIGANERVDAGPGNGTLYNSLLTISEDGQLGNHHRKLVPTYTERLVWGNGDGRGLDAVSTSAGRVGGLICWEHWMPLARMAMHNSGEHIHVAVWPTVHELHQLASRHYAFEGRCFVLAVGLMMPAEDLPRELSDGATLQSRDSPWMERGGSAIIGPDTRYVLDPVFDREELLVSDLDLAQIDREMMTFDVSGHYARPDLFRFEKKDIHPKLNDD
ncbi:MAG TPA: carbon-nitrogen hydrolase family protein [Candidatus Sulfotelmatobacter sp.]|nr:carbon-nitrogen hydrolase family protein [Candidatus Sulfotelmatobacter sp.]